MKKTISILILVALMVSMISTVTLAHGGKDHNGATRQQPRYKLCAVDGCDLIGPHQHDGIWYCSQTGVCANYEICSVEGCTEIGLHEHDGAYYRCANFSARRGCGRGRGL